MQEDAPASLSPEGLAYPEEQSPAAIEVTADGPGDPLPVAPGAAPWPAAAAEAISDSAEAQPLPSTACAESTGEAGVLEGVPANGFSGERATAPGISSHIEEAADSGPDPAWPSDPPQDTALTPVLPDPDSEDSGQPSGGAPDLGTAPSASSTSAHPLEIHSARAPKSSGTPEHADASKLEPESPDPTLPGPVQKVDPAVPEDAVAPPLPPAAMEPADEIGDPGGASPAEPVGAAAEPDPPREIMPADPPVPPGEAAATTAPLPKYRPQLREHQGGGAAKRTAAKAPAAPSQDAAASLEAELCLEFQPGDWGIRLSLLLRRPDAMAEEGTVRVRGRDMALATIDGGLFEPISLAENDAAVLWQGVSAHGTEEAQRRWVRSGRPLHVFSERAGVSGFASVPRALIGQQNILLCEDTLAPALLACCSEAGSPDPPEVQGPGVPSGWRCFRGYRPQIAGAGPDVEDILLALNPLPYAVIELVGGISVSRSAWIAGHPPAIRILGSDPEPGQVTIDGAAAGRDQADQWTAPGWDGLGAHTIRYAGISRRYEIIHASHDSPWWPAHAGASGLLLAGALASGRTGCPAVILAGPASWLIGAHPGEIAWASALPGGLSAVAAPSFVPVWAIAPKSGRHRQAPRLLASYSTPGAAHTTTKTELRAWCELVRSAARPPGADSGEDAATLWRLYMGRARTLRRRLR